MAVSKYNPGDFIGVGASSICLVHCLATPLLISLGATFIAGPAITYLFIIVSFFAIFKATEDTRSIRIALFLWVSFWGFLFSALFHDEYHWLRYAMYLFSVLIIVGHILNMRHCRFCEKERK